ncbi:MAG TPA: F420-0--gamma-glutamyl ligase [Eubacteriaceae bacterium]|nr:F420-0--gamma-glutamyl ligase [Eubacteriaceae bacterium]
MSEKKKKVKHPEVEINGTTYLRIPIKTHVVMKDDVLIDVIKKYISDVKQPGDLLFISEKIVAITQGRAYPLKDIKPRPLANTLSKYVTKTPAGIGLGMPETMEMALREVGTPRILYAAFMSAITKLLGKKGVFYDIAGYKAKSIDGPTPNTIPPYNQYVVLGPEHPKEVAEEISKACGIDVAVVDINDLDGDVLGSSSKKYDDQTIVRILKDNPLGQDHEQTPLGIIRETRSS